MTNNSPSIDENIDLSKCDFNLYSVNRALRGINDVLWLLKNEPETSVHDTTFNDLTIAANGLSQIAVALAEYTEEPEYTD